MKKWREIQIQIQQTDLSRLLVRSKFPAQHRIIFAIFPTVCNNVEQTIHFEGYNPYACSSRHKNANKMSLRARMSLHEEFNERDEVEQQRSGVEIPPPMDMTYFNSEKKSGVKNKASNQMAEAFLQGLKSVKRPQQEDSEDSESE